ncbi:MAG: methylenetetrahydrofolate reductase [Actinomycetota bacterium]|nr:methylenetetrahydrofolate reductase [Actinomycetota bacterium]
MAENNKDQKGSFQKSLEEGKFTLTCEIGPPKGVNTGEITETGNLLKGLVDGINVTDLQSSVMRLGSLVTCHLLKEMDLDPIFQMTCRDRNRMALQSDLVECLCIGDKKCFSSYRRPCFGG